MAKEKSNPFLRDRAQEIRAGALAACNGDTTQALILLSQKTDEVTLIANECQADNKVLIGVNSRMKEWIGIDDRGWLEKLWDSDTTKWVTFGIGIWVGVELVKVAE